MVYTSTSLSKYNNCPRLFRYEYVDLIDKYQAPFFAEDSSALKIGRAVHLIKAGKNYKEVELDEYEEAKVEVMINMSLHAEVVLNYPDINILDTEVELGMQFNDYRIAGKLDALVEIGDNLWVMDYKTSRYEFKDAFNYERKRQFDIYNMLARTNGYDTIGTIIYFIRRPSLWIQKSSSPEGYLKRCREDMIKRPESYYALVRVPCKETRRRRAEVDIINTIAHIKTDKKLDYFRRNDTYCNEYKGKCIYAGLCEGIISSSDCAKKDTIHRELEGDLRYPIYKEDNDE